MAHATRHQQARVAQAMQVDELQARRRAALLFVRPAMHDLWSSSPPSPQIKHKETIRTCLTQTGAKVSLNWTRAIFYASRITWRGGIPGGGPGPAPWTATHGTGRQRHRGYRPRIKLANTHVAFTCQCPPLSPCSMLAVGPTSCTSTAVSPARANIGQWMGLGWAKIFEPQHRHPHGQH